MKTNRKSKILAYIFFISLFNLYITEVKGQVDNFCPNAIYVKVIDGINKTLPNYSSGSLLPDSNLVNIISFFNINKIYKPFQVPSNAKLDRVYRIEFNNYSFRDSLIKVFKLMSFIEYAEKIPINRTSNCSSVNDYPTITANNYHLEKIKACDAWGIQTGSSSVKIAIVDDGFNISHPDLISKVALHYDVSNNQSNVSGLAMSQNDCDHYQTSYFHGSMLAGLAGASTNNSIGISSIGYNTSLILIKAASDFLPATTICTGSGISPGILYGYEGIIYAVNQNADIINCSWGSSEFSITNKLVIDWATSQNVLIVAAAGNDYSTNLHFPASYDNVLSVGATDNQDNVTTFSNFGSSVDVFAPGQAIYTTTSKYDASYNFVDGYDYASGTSFSSPIVAGLCALIKAQNPTYTPSQIKNCVIANCDNIDSQNPTLVGNLGYGRINAFKSLSCLSSNLSIVSSLNNICPNTSFSCNLSISGITPQSIQWNIPNGTCVSNCNTSNPTFKFNSPGIYKIAVTVTDINGYTYSQLSNDIKVVGISDYNYTYTNSINKLALASYDICNGMTYRDELQVYGDLPIDLTYSFDGNVSTISNVYSNMVPLYIEIPNHLFSGLQHFYVTNVTSNGLSCVSAFQSHNISIGNCCSEFINNGDFNSGNSGFLSSFSNTIGTSNPINCPGDYTVENVTGIGALFPTYNNWGNSLNIDGWKTSLNSCNTLTPLPFVGYNVGQYKTIWKETLPLVQNKNFIFSFFVTNGYLTTGTNTPLKLLVKIYDANNVDVLNNIGYSSSVLDLGEIIVPPHETTCFQQGLFNFGTGGMIIPPYTTFVPPFTIEINQFEYFNDASYDFLIDKISVKKLNEIFTNFDFLTPPLTNPIHCFNSPGMLSTNYSGASGYSFNWTTPMGNFTTPSIGNNSNSNPLQTGDYIVTVSDAYGCSATNTWAITNNKHINGILSPNNCHNNSSSFTETFILNTINFYPPLNYSVINSSNINVYSNLNTYSPSISFNLTSVGNYTISVVDANGCSLTSIIKIKETPNIVLSNNNNCVSTSNPGSVIVSTQSTNSPFLYQMNNGNFVSNNIFTNISASGTYTFTVKDANGCTNSTTTLINANTITLTPLVSTPPNCSSIYTISVSSSNSNLSYSWVPQNTSASTYTVNLASFPIYTAVVTATDANGCTLSTSISISPTQIMDPDFCACSNYSLPNSTITVMWNNSNSTNLINKINTYNSSNSPQIPISTIGGVTTIGSAASVTKIMLQGAFVLNNNITFVNCKIVMVPYMIGSTNTTEIITGNFDLTMNGCDVSGCTQMWQGIIGSSPTNSMTINNCLIKDMLHGIQSQNGHFLNVTNSTFYDNYIGLNYINTPWGYTNTIENCYFISSGNPLLPPKNTQSKSEIGIVSDNCSELRIGNLSTGIGNHFEGIYTGIWIKGRTSNKPNSSIGHIMIYNNDFFEINDDNGYTNAGVLGKINSTFINGRGVGVFAHIAKGKSTTGSNYIEIGTLTNNSTFNLCDKAVVTNSMSLNAFNNRIDETLMGFMNTGGLYKYYSINNNNINGCLQGISQDGDAYSTRIMNNSIVLANQNWYNGTYLIYPWGINIRNYNNANTNQLQINANNINILPDHGHGIVLSSNAPNSNTTNNIVTFSCTNKVNNYINPWLHGIYSENCMGGTYRNNSVSGNSYVLNNIASVGYRYVTSPHLNIECNSTSNNVTGMMVDGDCGTSFDAVNGNVFTNHASGLWFRYLGGHGKFGDVGSMNSDINNIWNGIYSINNNSMPNKVFRSSTSSECIAPFPIDRFFTNSSTLQQSESTAPVNSQNCKYLVTDNPSASKYICPDGPEPMPNGNGGGIELVVLDSNLAIDIANDSIVYTSYPEVSEWLAQKRLFRELTEDEQTLLAHAELITFYNNKINQNLGKVERLNMALALISDSLIAGDTLVFDSLRNEIALLNNSITSGNAPEMNERWINEILNFVSLYGQDSLNSSQVTQLGLLANNCPLIAGSAVYKARSIWSYFNSNVTYDDKQICNNLGSYKKDNIDPDDSLMNNFVASNKTMVIPMVDKVILYPNPTDNDLNISYNLIENKDAKLYIFDILGRHIETIELPKYVNRVTIKIEDWHNGIYSYKFIQDGRVLENGKFVKK